VHGRIGAAVTVCDYRCVIAESNSLGEPSAQASVEKGLSVRTPASPRSWRTVGQIQPRHSDTAGVPGEAEMTTLTIRLPEDTTQRLKQLAASRGISLNKLMEELGTAALAVRDTETRFRLMANAGDRKAALDILARLDERGCQTTSS
jgi:hypothetical protein